MYMCSQKNYVKYKKPKKKCENCENCGDLPPKCDLDVKSISFQKLLILNNKIRCYVKKSSITIFWRCKA